MSEQAISLRRIKQADDFVGRQPGIGFVQPDCRSGLAGVQVDACQPAPAAVFQLGVKVHVLAADDGQPLPPPQEARQLVELI